ncbi:hypothetical protein HK098_002252 [Nowakowskiella sp. JEL0407]|nr:hypothetical protein HK098_002252 [Nowakowskiella sp. JEL0407]
MHYDSDSDSGESEVTAQEIDQPIPTPKVIVIGKTGSGKSETVNLLTGYNDKKDKNYCYVSNDPDSCTTTCKVVTAKISCRQSLEVVDTPGLFDTENRSEEMFIGVTEQLKKSGGFVYNLTKDVRVEKQLLNIMRALHLVLGDYFSSSVVVVRTSPPRYESRDEMPQNLETLKLHVESKLSTLGSKFFGVIGLSQDNSGVYSTEMFVEYSKTLLERNDCGVPAGVTKTWK